MQTLTEVSLTPSVYTFRHAKIVDLDEDHLFGVVRFESKIDGVGYGAFRKGAGNLVEVSPQLTVGAMVSGTVAINGSNMGVVEKITVEQAD